MTPSQVLSGAPLVGREWWWEAESRTRTRPWTRLCSFLSFYMPPRLAATSTTRLFSSPLYYSSRSFRSSSQRLHTPESASTPGLDPVDATPPAPGPSTSRSQWTKDITKPIPKKRPQKRKTEEAPAAARPSFTGLGLSMPIILTLKATFPNVREATEAQRRFIPAIVQGRQDVLLKGQTGSGKCVVCLHVLFLRRVDSHGLH